LPGIAIFVVGWAVAMFWGTHSEGFKFLESKVRGSAEIQRRIGNIRKVSIPLLGQYHEKFADSDRKVKMTVTAAGDRGSVTVRAVMQKKNGVWNITESYIGDQQIDLNRN